MRHPSLRALAALLLTLSLAFALPAAAATVDLNTAPAEALVAAGLTEKQAEAVLAYRTLIGPFKAPEELGQVKGIGKRTLEKLADKVGVGDGVTVVKAETSLTEADILRAGAAETLGPRGKVNINTASPEELASLPKFREGMARRVIEYREEHGAFKSIEEIRGVKGLGAKTFEAIAPYLEVGDGITIKRLSDFKSAPELLAGKASTAEVRIGPTAKGDGRLHVRFLDVGQGDSILVVSPDGTTMLVDAGEKPMGRKVVAPALQRAGISKLNYLVLTHAHSDHLGGMGAVLKQAAPANVLDPGYPATSLMYRNFLQEIEAGRARYAFGRDGVKLDLGGGATATFLHPDARFLQFGGNDTGEGGDASAGSPVNINSSVMKVEFGDFSLLLTGDAEADSEARLLKTHKERLKSKVLKAPHHGSEFSGTPDFLAAVGAEAVVISCGVENKFNHPSPLFLRRCEMAGMKVHRTDLSGEVALVSDGKTYRITVQYPDGGKPVEAKSSGKAIAKAGVQHLGTKVDLNTATIEELARVPGLGERMAKRIVDHRAEHGPFRKVEDLGDVKGFGERIVEKVLPNVTVGGAGEE